MRNDITESILSTVNIDKAKAEKTLAWLIRLEAENVRTKELSETKIISVIQKRIEEDAECY